MTRARPSRAARDTGDMILIDLLRVSVSLNRERDRTTRVEMYAEHSEELHRRFADPDEEHLSTVARIISRFDPVASRRAEANRVLRRIEDERTDEG